ncbi:MAG TPA: hypothetical protein VE395_02110 [Acidimicrobiales bacterium]|nr:hypothetical protein [Acidimicrobiales bacterium]
MATRPPGDWKVAASWVFIVSYVILAVRSMATGSMKPPPRLDWAFALVFYGVAYWYVVWVGRSLFRIVRALVRIRRNPRDAWAEQEG